MENPNNPTVTRTALTMYAANEVPRRIHRRHSAPDFATLRHRHRTLKEAARAAPRIPRSGKALAAKISWPAPPASDSSDDGEGRLLGGLKMTSKTPTQERTSGQPTVHGGGLSTEKALYSPTIPC